MTPRNFCLLAAFVVAAPALAQSDHRLEVFGGFAHQREDDRFTGPRNGWTASQTAYIRPWLGVEVELSGLYGESDLPAFGDRPAVADQDHSQQSYLAGPRFRLLTKERFAVSAHALFGVSQHRFESPLFVEEFPFPLRFQSETTGFGSAVGVSFDVHLSERFSWRIQPDWLYRQGAGPDNSLRLSTGIVFRFGK